MSRKIGILTQPLHDNYGGLLQAYTLSETLKNLGHEPVVINRKAGHTSPIRKIAGQIKRKLAGNKYAPNETERAVISKHTLSFRNKFFPNLTDPILSNKDMWKLNKAGFDTFIVGSDQCWRPRYSPNITNYFLDFAENQKGIKRIAYAASFGTEEWEFTPEQTEKCSKLTRKFDAVSVREDSGVKLCEKHFLTKAEHVLDPTMLMSRYFYDALVESEGIEKSNGNLKAYVLDKSREKSEVIRHIEKKMGLSAFEVMPIKRLGKEKPKQLLDYQFPSPLKWLRGYQDAEFVIADSFHGIVFAILYNIPFIAIGNKRRGMARFSSLLKMFDLEERLLTDLSLENVDRILERVIDWEKVNAIVEEKREYSMSFLKRNLV